VDLSGRVVGINTRGSSVGQNLNFAVPVDIAREVIGKLLAKAEPDKIARVERSDLGMQFKPLQDLESFYNLDINRGVLVNNVDKNSPATKAGVRTQDILLELNGAPTNVRFPEELAPLKKRIADLPVGSDVTMKLKRGKDTVELTAKTVKLESAQGEEKELKAWGMSVRDVTRRYAIEENLDDDKGVVVTTLNPGYPAAKAELADGDVIRSVDGKEATDLDEFMKLYKQSIDARETRVLIEFQRGRSRRSAVLRINYATPSSAPGATTHRAGTSEGAPPPPPAPEPATQP
jgi:serine protease Do